MRRAVKRNGLVLVVETPVLARHAQVPVAGIVGDDGSFALIHLPISYEMACGRVLGLALLHQSRRHVASLIPEREFVDGPHHALSDGKWSVAVVGRHCLVGEEVGGGGVFGHSSLQRAALGRCGIVHREICPLAHRHLRLRCIDVVANLHQEVAVIVHADHKLLLSLSVRQQSASALEVHPGINGKTLACQIDVGLGSGCVVRAGHAECGGMRHLRTVEHTGNDEVGSLGQLTLEEVLVELNAHLVARRENAVGRCRQAERLRPLHVLHESYLLTGVVHLLIAVRTYREDAEGVVTVAEVAHGQLVRHGSRAGQQLVVLCLVSLVDYVFANQCPVGVALLAILYAERLEVVVVAVKLAERDVQVVAGLRVERSAVEFHRHCR